MKMEYFGKVDGGKLKIRKRADFDNDLQQFEGKEVEIIVQRKRRIRSIQQNKYYWACIRLLSEYTGHTTQELHEVVKFKFLRKERVIEKTGEVVEYLGSTTELTRVEFIEFMDNFSAWAGEMGCTFPQPNTQFEISA